jgi:phage terminase small subunit
MALTKKQDDFARAIVRGLSQSDAYRLAYDVRPGTKAESIHNRGSELMRKSEVVGRIAQLRAPAAKKATITLESHLADLEKLRNMAVKAEQYSAAITAEVARGKASGVHVERSAVAVASNRPHRGMTDAELDQVLAEAATLLQRPAYEPDNGA